MGSITAGGRELAYLVIVHSLGGGIPNPYSREGVKVMVYRGDVLPVFTTPGVAWEFARAQSTPRTTGERS